MKSVFFPVALLFVGVGLQAAAEMSTADRITMLNRLQAEEASRRTLDNQRRLAEFEGRCNEYAELLNKYGRKLNQGEITIEKLGHKHDLISAHQFYRELAVSVSRGETALTPAVQAVLTAGHNFDAELERRRNAEQPHK